MKFSVVVATYNRREALRRCLVSLQGQTLAPVEIIVVDDCSSDGTTEMVRADFPNVRLLRQERNRGPAAARNRGIAAARGHIVAFTDDDCVPPADWLQQFIQAFREDPGIVGVGGFQEAADELIAANPIAYAEHAMRLHKWGPRASQVEQGGAEVPGFGTNNVAYRRDALLAVDGFDEAFPVAAGEDADLKVRLAQAAFAWPDTPTAGPFLYLPLKVWHEREYTWRAQWRMGVQRGIGAYYFENKHGGAPALGRVLLRWAKRTLRLAVEFFSQTPQVALAIYLLRLGDCVGQLQMVVVGELRRKNRRQLSADREP